MVSLCYMRWTICMSNSEKIRHKSLKKYFVKFFVGAISSTFKYSNKVFFSTHPTSSSSI